MIFPFNAGEVFKIALTIEDNGRLFYEKAASKAFSEDLSQFFKALGTEELSHKAVFTALMKKLPPATTAATVWDPDNDLDKYLKAMADQHVFNQKPAAIEDKLSKISAPAEAIKMAMGFEKDTIVFFLELQSVTDDQESRNEIAKLLNEERKHLARLTDKLQRLAA
ncbi:MAG: ferritin family protein [Candidatus Adiutrix sp.]|jgi:rubrerythrin|nr:ferritin family protein [Candidatus Adiutrix sp.]